MYTCHPDKVPVHIWWTPVIVSLFENFFTRLFGAVVTVPDTSSLSNHLEPLEALGYKVTIFGFLTGARPA